MSLQETTVSQPRAPRTRKPKISAVVATGIAIPEVSAPAKQIKGSIIKAHYKAKYKASGTYSCGDQLAEELRMYVAQTIAGRVVVNVERLKEVAMVNGVWKPSYENLNVGQRRMTIGNCLRAKMKNGDSVDIGGAILAPEVREP